MSDFCDLSITVQVIESPGEKDGNSQFVYPDLMIIRYVNDSKTQETFWRVI